MKQKNEFNKNAVQQPLKPDYSRKILNTVNFALFQGQLGHPISVIMWKGNEKLRMGKNSKNNSFF